MDVLQLNSNVDTARSASGASAYTKLNALERSADERGRGAKWDAAMNRALGERKIHAPAGINGATTGEAGRAARHAGDLNFRMRAGTPTQFDDLNQRLRALGVDVADVQSTARAAPIDPAATASKSTDAAPRDAKLEQAAQTLVNQFFMGSMMKQMRNSPFKDETFSGGKAGAAYAGLFDQHVAEHSGHRIAKGLVQSMLKAYRKHDAAAAVAVAAPADLLAQPNVAPNAAAPRTTQPSPRGRHDAVDAARAA